MRGGKRVDPIVRFWKQTDKSGEENWCWIWTGALDKDGYGQFTNGEGRNVRSHRYSWEIHNGTIPTGLRILHGCDNPPCVRPDHLFLGTDADNLKDAVGKGRLNIKGEDNPAAKLTESNVRLIRSLSKLGWSQKRIARAFGVSEFPIGAILLGKLWKHVK